MDGKNMLLSHLGTVFCATFFVVTEEKKQYNDICWKLPEGYSI